MMRNMIKAGALMLALTIPAWADGNMGAPIAPPQDGGRQAIASDSAKSGEMGCPRTGSEIALSLLNTLLALV